MAKPVKFPWWQWWPFWPWRIVEIVESADEIAPRLPRNGASLVGTLTKPKWIAFDCPCRNGHRIMVNADPQRRPFWRIEHNRDGRLTLSPSVDYSDQVRRCHYIVRGGRILWAKDSAR